MAAIVTDLRTALPAVFALAYLGAAGVCAYGFWNTIEWREHARRPNPIDAGTRLVGAAVGVLVGALLWPAWMALYGVGFLGRRLIG